MPFSLHKAKIYGNCLKFEKNEKLRICLFVYFSSVGRIKNFWKLIKIKK